MKKELSHLVTLLIVRATQMPKNKDSDDKLGLAKMKGEGQNITIPGLNPDLANCRFSKNNFLFAVVVFLIQNRLTLKWFYLVEFNPLGDRWRSLRDRERHKRKDREREKARSK